MADPSPPTAPLCPRCPGVHLRRLDGSRDEISFFECPSCDGHYARKASGSLTYRWRHPISLALYGVLFSPNPAAVAPYAADLILRQLSSDALVVMIKEIELELEHPTQQVREILDNPQSEATCRQFLADVAKRLRERLAAA